MFENFRQMNKLLFVENIILIIIMEIINKILSKVFLNNDQYIGLELVARLSYRRVTLHDFQSIIYIYYHLDNNYELFGTPDFRIIITAFRIW